MSQITKPSWLRVVIACSLILFVGLALAPWQQSWASHELQAGGNGAIALSAQDAEAPLTTAANGVGVHYRVKLEQAGWSKWKSKNKTAGTTKRELGTVGFQIALDRGAYTGKIAYRVHLMSGEWTSWKKSRSRFVPNAKVDAIQMKLMGSIAKDYAIEYRTYLQGIGWQRKMHNGEIAGAENQGMHIQALRVKLVSKKKLSGWIKNKNGSYSYYRAGKPLANTWIVSDKHPIETTWTSGLQRYWIDANGILAVDRYVDPNTQLDSNAGWTAYATPSGLVARGKFTNADGFLLADNEGALFTKSQWLTTDAFDGTQQRYRLVKKGVVAVVKTGLFKVKGRTYYGYPDGRGYLARSTVICIGTTWYKASENGVLTDYSNQNSSIVDRYVDWAIAIANDDTHGYSQHERWGPDYDCSSFVCSSLLAAGFPNSGATWTGNMKAQLKKIGFVWHKGTKDLKRGDIMLVHTNLRQHTEIYIGDNMLVGAHIAETGDVFGETGDQTGNEISVTPYYNAPWQGYLRYKG